MWLDPGSADWRIEDPLEEDQGLTDWDSIYVESADIFSEFNVDERTYFEVYTDFLPQMFPILRLDGMKEDVTVDPS